MRAGELQPPAGYSDPWIIYAMFAVVVVAVYYLTVWKVTQPRRNRAPRPGSSRKASMDRLHTIQVDVAKERITPRRGHQLISETVRTYAADKTGLQAQSMTLEDLRVAAPPKLVDLLTLIYPPEFGPGEELPREAFDEALTKARELVGSWS